MVMILNTMVVLISLCLIVLRGFHEVSLPVYMLVIIIEYIAVLAMNAGFREAARRCVIRKGQFGEKNKYYDAVHIETLKDDLEQMEESGFEYFIGDLLRLNGYKVKKLSDDTTYGVNLMAEKEKQKILVQVKHVKDSQEKIDQSAVCQVVGAEAVFKADSSMIVTNGSFSEPAVNQAAPNQTLMIDGRQLENMVREKMAVSKEKNDTAPVLKES